LELKLSKGSLKEMTANMKSDQNTIVVVSGNGKMSPGAGRIKEMADSKQFASELQIQIRSKREKKEKDGILVFSNIPDILDSFNCVHVSLFS